MGRKIKSVFDVSNNSVGVSGVYLNKINGLYEAGIPSGEIKNRKIVFQSLQEAVRARRSAEKVFDQYENADIARAILSKTTSKVLLSMTSIEEIQSVLDRVKDKKVSVSEKQNVDTNSVKIPYVFKGLAQKVTVKKDQGTPLSKIFSLILNRYDQSSNLNKLYFKAMSKSGKTTGYMDKLIVDIFYSKKIELMESRTLLKFSDNKYLKFDGENFEIVDRNDATEFTESNLKYISSKFPVEKFQEVKI